MSRSGFRPLRSSFTVSHSPVMRHPPPSRIHSKEKPYSAQQLIPMLSVRKRKSARKSLPAFSLLIGTHEASDII